MFTHIANVHITCVINQIFSLPNPFWPRSWKTSAWSTHTLVCEWVNSINPLQVNGWCGHISFPTFLNCSEHMAPCIMKKRLFKHYVLSNNHLHSPWTPTSSPFELSWSHNVYLCIGFTLYYWKLSSNSDRGFAWIFSPVLAHFFFFFYILCRFRLFK